MIRRPPRSTQSRSSAASDVYKRQVQAQAGHVSIESTRVYLHLTNDWLAGEYRRAADLIELGALMCLDALHRRATAAGAEVVAELTDTDHGSRDVGFADPEGNRFCVVDASHG